MSSRKILVIGSISMLTSCVSAIHTHKLQDKVEVVYIDDNSKLASLVDNINKNQSEIYAEKYFLKLPKLEAISEEDINFFYYQYDSKFFTKREKRFLLLNNKSLYVGKSPVLNKNDSYFNRKTNIILCAVLLNNRKKPQIRSPGYYI
jgi:hypothetical protein